MGSLHETNSSAVRKRIESREYIVFPADDVDANRATDTFDNEEGEEYEASRFGGFGDYMRRKKIKLQNLDAEIRASSPGKPLIFRGVVAYVNGYTQPSLNDIHNLIVSHGGGFLQYLDGKTVATHIIASSLTPKKREEFRRYRIVKPAWVVESVKAGRLLSWDSYRVVDEGHSQKVLRFDSGRLSSQSNIQISGYKAQSDASWYTAQLKGQGRVTEEVGSPVPVPATHYDATSSLPTSSTGKESDYGEFPSKGSLVEDQDTPTTPKQAVESVDEKSPILDDSVEKSASIVEHRPEQTSAPVEIPPIHEPISVRPGMTPEEYNAQLFSDPRMRNSSVMNPEFVQQFYRESRLHHLSTWKAGLKAQLQAATQEKSQSQTATRKRLPGARRYILHVDFDSFFAAVSIQKRPELADKPVAVAHGTGNGSEIASCNYPARAHGIKNGMWMKGALQMCPDLQVVPYDFPAYEEASRKFYSSILAIEGVVQSVSIDEALVDITMQCLEAGGSDGRGISEGSIYREQARADEVAAKLRAAIKDKTGCAVSVGIGANILQAKVALRKAKPAGQFHLKPDDVLGFIGNLTVQDLPGVAYSIGAKLEELGVTYVKDIRELSREKLVSALGPKTGIKLWEYARGIDRTEVGTETMRKSVSAEINWGIRFVTQAQAEEFVYNLCGELQRRLVENLVKGRQLTMRIMRRSADAPLEPVKHLGHGKCDVFNKSIILGVATNAKEIVAKEAVSILRSFGFSPGDLRGLGVQMTKLEPVKSMQSSQQQLNFKTSPVRPKSEPKPAMDPDEVDSPRKGDRFNLSAVSSAVSHAPSLNDSSHKPLNLTGTQFILPSQADPEVVAELPGDIRSRFVSMSKRAANARSESPTPLSRPGTATRRVELPPQSQLDPDTLSALPEDVRSEILAYYERPSTTAVSAPVAAPRPQSSSSSKLKVTTPTKKRRGRPPLKASKAPGNATLTQSNFIRLRPSSAAGPAENAASRQSSPQIDEPVDISEDFLAALPEDIRREVLEEQKRIRMQQRSALNVPATRKPPQPKSSGPPAVRQKRLQLPPRPERPTFTSKKLSTLPELREALNSWYSSFETDGPFAEDIEALSKYLRRVVLEEKDIEKAVSVTEWLGWLISDGREKNKEPTESSTSETRDANAQSYQAWTTALDMIQESIQAAVQDRGLPPVEFSL
ncbi:DNA damage repair protein Mus42 [Paecilomyces variotii No. 5]|uniref:DNA repair protein REV1 n=1 Tax=Byssochlamys spectabilis (strain No. 5 / NBRC 109023) TaxID=1356009 RepID=V5FV70_BYSSN|nr:DNA damage repair protein Mus42 [Paecilomyces variotii No. 5]